MTDTDLSNATASAPAGNNIDPVTSATSGNGGAPLTTDADGAKQKDPPPSTSKEVTVKLKVGGQDLAGYTIEHIFKATRQFIIYESDGQVRYILPDDYDTAKALRQ